MKQPQPVWNFARRFLGLLFREIDVKLLLPGHGSLFSEHRKRIDNLRTHHRRRSDATYAALGEDGENAYEAPLALDGLFSDRDSLDTSPPIRRFIHTRHTFAQLQHLTAQGRARKEHHHGRILFFSCQPKLATCVITDHITDGGFL